MLGYQSAWTDPASGKDLMGARWYSPSAGDFTSADTVHVSPDPDPAAGDPFAYAADNPLTYTDPTGHLISAGSPATNPNYQADTAYANVFTQTYQRVGVTQAKANAAKAAAAVVAAKKAAAQRAQQQAAAAAAKKRAEQKAAAEEAAKKRAEQQAAAEEAAKQQALNRSRSTALNPDDGKTGQVFINPGARDLGTGTTKTPVGNHGTETLITPGGSPVPLIFTNPGPPDLGTGTTKTPISDQGGIINAAEDITPEGEQLVEEEEATAEAKALEKTTVDEILSNLRAGRSAPNLEVDTDAELNQVFDDLSQGGAQISSTYPGKMVNLPDGTRVGLRAASRSGGATIDVFKSDGTYIKVHLP